MDDSIDDFCQIVIKLEKTNAQKALALLWYFDREKTGLAMSAGQLT